jgi:hypothetical protein
MTVEQTQAPPADVPAGDVVARGARYYRITRFIMTAILLGYGAWFLHDGFVVYPAENAAALAKGADPDKVPHNHMSTIINQGCGILMPPLGLAMLGWTLCRSRGEFRLSGGVLTAPGHPPIPLDRIQQVDKRKWDRKGIAVVEYGLVNPPTSRKLILDDFIYERDPIDEIYKRIEQALLTPAPKAPGKSSAKPTAPKTRLPPRPTI